MAGLKGSWCSEPHSYSEGARCLFWALCLAVNVQNISPAKNEVECKIAVWKNDAS